MTQIETTISSYMQPGVRVHLCGIGGVSMSALAEVLHSRGVLVQGSDMSESAAVARLRSVGIPVAVGDGRELLKNARCIIRTAALRDDHPEIVAAKESSIPVFERAQAWGTLMRQYKQAVCLSGTHGKTTTTSMTTHIFMAAEKDPTVMIGGTLPLLHSSYRVGQGDTIILESCEYCNSFHHFFPTVAVVLNVEADHLDFFRDLQDVQASFRHFAELVPAEGHVICNGDDENAMAALAGLTTFTFGMSPAANCRAENLTWQHGMPTFTIVVQGMPYTAVTLRVGGMHNVYNALAAASAAYVLGISGEAVAKGLGSFTGADRRFEYKGEYGGAAVYDDYAHHPGELHALLTMARQLDYKRVICAFQPHTYTRTKALFDDFVQELKAADVVLLAEIYAAREQNTIGISSADLARNIPGAIYCPTLPGVTEELRRIVCPGDLVITVGAGNIVTAGEALVREAKA